MNVLKELSNFLTRPEVRKGLDDMSDKLSDISPGKDLWNDPSASTAAVFARLNLGGQHSASGSGAADWTRETANPAAGGDHMMAHALGAMLDRIEGIEKSLKSLPMLASVVSEIAKDRFGEEPDGDADNEKKLEEESEAAKKAELAAAESNGDTVLTVQLKGMMERIAGQRLAKAAKRDTVRPALTFMPHLSKAVDIDGLLDQCTTPAEATALATVYSRIELLKAGKIDQRQVLFGLARTREVDAALSQLGHFVH